MNGRFGDLSGRIRITLVTSLLLSALLIGFIGFLSYRITALNVADETAALRESNQNIRNMLAQTDAILKSEAKNWATVFRARFAGDFSLTAGSPGATPLIRSGRRVLNDRFDEVDAFTRDSNGNVATIFVRHGSDFVRIATSLRKEDGSRATGTVLDHQHPAYAPVSEGREFTGVAGLFGRQYMTHYQPLRDAAGATIGILFIGMDIMNSLDQVKKTVKAIKIGQTGYAYVLDARDGPSAGTLIIHPTMEGRNVAGAKDGAGREFIRDILRQRNGSITYPWTNQPLGEAEARDKIVVFSEFAEWQWIIASGSYTDEVFSVADEVRTAFATSTVVLGLAALLGLAYLINRHLISPLIAASRVELVMSIRSRIALYVSVLVLLMTAGTVLLLDRFAEQRLLDAIGKQLNLTAAHEAQSIDEAIVAKRNGLGAVAGRFPVEFLDRQSAAQRWVDDRIVLRSLFDDFFVVDARGEVVADLSHVRSDKVRFDRTDWFIDGMAATQPTIFEPRHDPQLGVPAIVFTAPIRDNGSATRGLFVGIVALDRSHAFLDAASAKLGRLGHLALISRQLTYITHPDKSALLQPIPAPENNPAIADALRGRSSNSHGTDARGRRGIHSIHPVPSTGWLLDAFSPEDEYMGEILQLRWVTAGLVLASLSILALTIWFAVGRALRPLKRLREAMCIAQTKGFEQTPPLVWAGKDEFAELGKTFNAMAAAIDARRRDLAQSEQEMREITSALGFGIYVLDAAGKLVFINPAAEQLLGWDKNDLIGHDAHRMFHYQHADGSPYPIDECPLHQVLARGRSVHVLSDWLITKQGVRVPVEIFATPIFRNGELHGAAAAFQDISMQLRTSERIRHQASHDPLTGLANRRQAMDALAQLVYRGRRYHEGFSLLMLDLDGFKNINDHYGHPAGDALLIQVAQRLRKSLRQSDLLARLGGDEFAILLGNISSADAMTLADKLIASISLPYPLEHGEAKIGLSIGVAAYPDTTDAVESLIAAADEALYLSKSRGRNRATLAAPRSRETLGGTEGHAAFLAIDDTLRLGASYLDQAHLELAERLNQLERLVHDPAWHDEMLRCFDALAALFVEHLAREEQWLGDHAPQDHTLHVSNPASVQVEIRLLRDELAGDEPFIALLKIRDWLVDHIHSDERMRPLIAAQPGPVPAQP